MKPSRQPDPLVGRRLAHFEVEGRLGSGGMGVVYKARDTRLGRTVALKVMPAHMTEDEERRERFLAEARAASALDHPNIGTIFDLAETNDGQPLIVMAHYEGQTLAQRLERGALTLEQSLEVAIQTARGLAEAHGRGILHRDIKPSNLMITDPGTVKILDFGLARIAGETRLTHSGMVMGTAAYMSPEQANAGITDSRSDVWSLGVVLYEMVSGRVPFPGDTTASVLYAIVHRPPADLGALPEGVREVIDRALAKDPRERYADGGEFLLALEKLRQSFGAGSEQLTRTMVVPGTGNRGSQWDKSAPPEVRGETAPGTAKPRFVRRWLPWTAGLLVALAVFFPIRHFWPPEEKGLAVLPFSIVSGDAALADGLLETITSRLTDQEHKNKSLWVVPASEVRRRKVASVDDARKQFGANRAVTGSVQQTGPSLRLTINLIDTRTMRQLGSAVLDESSGDYLRLQDRALAKLAELLEFQVAESPDRGSQVPAAQYEAYLRGVGLLARWDKGENLQDARVLLEGLVKTAPGFAAARATLANVYWQSYNREHDPQWILRAREQLQEAQQLDPKLTGLHETMGRIQQATGRRDLAVLEYQEALKTDPRSAEAIVGLARTYEELGRPRDAEDSYKRAIATRPASWSGYNSLGTFYYRQKRYAEAETTFRKAIELTPDNWGGYTNLGNALKLQGKAKEALAAFDKAMTLSNNYAIYQNAGTLNYEMGNFRRAAELFQLGLKQNDKDYRVWGSVASALDRAGIEPEKQRKHLLVAAEKAEALLKVTPEDQEARAYLATYYARLGQREKARAALDWFAVKLPDEGAVWNLIAESWVLLGDRVNGSRALEMALVKGYPTERVDKNPTLKPLLDALPVEKRGPGKAR